MDILVTLLVGAIVGWLGSVLMNARVNLLGRSSWASSAPCSATSWLESWGSPLTEPLPAC